MPMLFIRDRGRSCLVDLAPGETLVLGRSPAVDLPVTSDRTSRAHCRFRADGTGHVLEDLGSQNGTWVGGEVLWEARRLVDGDEIEAGGVRIVYRKGA